MVFRCRRGFIDLQDGPVRRGPEKTICSTSYTRMDLSGKTLKPRAFSLISLRTRGSSTLEENGLMVGLMSI